MTIMSICSIEFARMKLYTIYIEPLIILMRGRTKTILIGTKVDIE